MWDAVVFLFVAVVIFIPMVMDGMADRRFEAGFRNAKRLARRLRKADK